jgi:DNA (cytosine-5)-methyltransferase 1
VEIEAFAAANLVSKMEAGELAPAPVWTDLKTFPVGIFRGAVDIITGGYPCQPFSAAGRRLGNEDPRHLWPYISEAIGEIRPRRVFFENVEGHISLGLNDVISDLEERGYDTAWGVFSAVEVGAPHQRKRVYIMGDSQSGSPWPRSGETDALGYWTGAAGTSGDCGTRPMGDSADERRGSTWAEDDVADTERPRLEGHPGDVVRGDQPGRNPSQAERPAAPEGLRGKPAEHDWSVEPGLGRVVDGCPDRVDRIRLLGNGVVPQTAAKAWIVLDEALRSPRNETQLTLEL